MLALVSSHQDKVKQKIADSTGHGPAGERRKALRAEQGELRTKTAGHKDERNSTLNQIKSLQEGMQKKIKDMQGAKSKTSYKSTAEIGQCPSYCAFALLLIIVAYQTRG